MIKSLDRNYKWQIIFHYGEDMRYFIPLYRVVTFGILRLKNIPNEGFILQKKDFKGFIIKLKFYLPFKINL